MDIIEGIPITSESQKKVDFYSILVFEEAPRKTGDEKPIARLNALTCSIYSQPAF